MSQSEIRPDTCSNPRCGSRSTVCCITWLIAVLGLTFGLWTPLHADPTPDETPPDKLKITDPSKISSKDVLYLEPQRELVFVDGRTYGIFRREIIRQALSITAREDFGLRTHDGVLGEAAPKDLLARQRLYVDAIFKGDKDSFVVVKQGDGKEHAAVLRIEIDPKASKDGKIAAMVAAADAWSRAEFTRLFQQAGVQAKSVVWRAESTLPDKVEMRLREMNIISQFTAVRAVHGEIKKAGESPELLGALARGYANLGVLTEHLWLPDHKVFKARAFLYAERLRRRLPADSWALWQQAYAETMMGFHADALADLQAAAKGKTTKPMPDWVALIEPSCLFQEAKLAELGTKPELAQLACFLRFLAVENPNIVRQTLEAADKALAVAPECTRVIQVPCSIGHVGNRQAGTRAYMSAVAAMINEKLVNVDDLSAVVKAIIQNKAQEPKIWNALAKEGEDDDGEPSWATLARLLQEERFLSIWERLYFMRQAWNVPVEEFVGQIKPYIEDHPRKDVILLYGLGTGKASAAEIAKRIDDMSGGDLEAHSVGVFIAIESAVNRKAGNAAFNRVWGHFDVSYRDDVIFLRQTNVKKKDLVDCAKEMLELSPHCGLGFYELFAQDRDLPDEIVKKWEEYESHQAAVLKILGLRYFTMNRPDDAERCVRALIKLSPDTTGYQMLANMNKARGRMDEWRAALDEVLKDSVQDLDHARVRIDIARYLMSKRQYKEALPYANKAAETWAEWALMCALDCNERAGEYEKAELWARRVSERYPLRWREWIECCLRTGKGDRKAAQAHAERFFDKFDKEHATIDDWFTFAVYFTSTDQLERTVDALDHVLKAKPPSAIHLLQAMSYDALKKPERRDELLKQATELRGNPELAKLFIDTLAKEGNELDLKVVDDFLDHAGAGKSFAAYLIGRFLDNRGKPKTANTYFNLAAAGNKSLPYVQMSVYRLRKEGLAPKPPVKKKDN